MDQQWGIFVSLLFFLVAKVVLFLPLLCMPVSSLISSRSSAFLLLYTSRAGRWNWMRGRVLPLPPPSFTYAEYGAQLHHIHGCLLHHARYTRAAIHIHSPTSLSLKNLPTTTVKTKSYSFLFLYLFLWSFLFRLVVAVAVPLDLAGPCVCLFLSVTSTNLTFHSSEQKASQRTTLLSQRFSWCIYTTRRQPRPSQSIYI